MLPPETMHTMRPVPARPASAAATGVAPAEGDAPRGGRGQRPGAPDTDGAVAGHPRTIAPGMDEQPALEPPVPPRDQHLPPLGERDLVDLRAEPRDRSELGLGRGVG